MHDIAGATYKYGDLYELTKSWVYDSFKVGTIMGMGILAPVVSLLRRKPIATTILRYGRNGAIFGVVAGPTMTEAMLRSKNATDDSIWDRCYRLRQNKGQVRTDRYASFCALGAGTATALLGQGPLVGVLTGYASGTVLSGVLGNMLDPPEPKESKPKEAKDEGDKLKDLK